MRETEKTDRQDADKEEAQRRLEALEARWPARKGS